MKNIQSILQILGLFLLIILTSLGANYILGGDTIISGSISVLLVILIYFLVEFLKKRKVQITKTRFSIGSMLLWLIFVILCLPIGILILHALNVEVNSKKEIKTYVSNLVNKNQEAINLFQSENQKYIAETYLEARNELDKYVNTSNVNEKKTIEAKLNMPRFGITNFSQINKGNFTNSANALQSALEIRSSSVLDSIQDRTKTILKNNLHLVNNWSRLRVVNAISELENMMDKNINQMNTFMATENFNPDVFAKEGIKSNEILSINRLENNQISIVKSEINLSSFTVLWKRYAPFWLIIPVLAFFLLLILPYLLEKTSGIYIGKNEIDEDLGGIEIK